MPACLWGVDYLELYVRALHSYVQTVVYQISGEINFRVRLRVRGLVGEGMGPQIKREGGADGDKGSGG